MMFPDHEMEAQLGKPQSPSGSHQSASGTSASDWEQFLNYDGNDRFDDIDGTNIDMFGDPIDTNSFLGGAVPVENTDFSSDFDSTQLPGSGVEIENGDTIAPSALALEIDGKLGSPSDAFAGLPRLEPIDNSNSQPVQAHASTAAASCVLSLPQASEPAVVASNAMSLLAMPDDSFQSSQTQVQEQVPIEETTSGTPANAAMAPHGVPNHGLPGHNSVIDLTDGGSDFSENPLFNPALLKNPPANAQQTAVNGFLPQHGNVLATVQSAGVDPYVPHQRQRQQVLHSQQQHQPQQQVLRPQAKQQVYAGGAPPLYQPQPVRAVPPRVITTPRGHAPARQHSSYMAQPPQMMAQQHMRPQHNMISQHMMPQQNMMPQQMMPQQMMPQQMMPQQNMMPQQIRPHPQQMRQPQGYANGYPAPRPAGMIPMMPESYPPQHPSPQVATNRLQQVLYGAYNPAPAQSNLKRKLPLDEPDDLPPPAKQIRHRRGGNRRPSNDPSLFYKPIPFPLVDWSPSPAHLGPRGNVFRYNNHGEWASNVRFSADNLKSFLFGPKGDGAAPSRQEKLTIWIQQTPAYDIHRYGPDCSICRWDKCPVKRNTISKGQFRVAFDERASLSGKLTDPFHVAGYMHLFCFEEVFDIYSLFFDGRIAVKADVRKFKYEERNPMTLSQELMKTVGTWQRAEGARLRDEMARGVNRRRETPSERKLWRALTRTVLAAPGYLQQLGRRNDIHLGTYEGDLRKYQDMVDDRVVRQREARMAGAEEAEDEGDDEVVITAKRTLKAPLRSSIAQHSLPGTRNDYPVLSVEEQHPPSQSRRPSLVRYSPAQSRKRGRSDEEESAPAKRPRFDIKPVNEHVTGAVRETLKGFREEEANRVGRTMQSWIPDVAEMPQYRRLELQGVVKKEADRVREGVVPKWGSLPGRF